MSGTGHLLHDPVTGHLLHDPVTGHLLYDGVPTYTDLLFTAREIIPGDGTVSILTEVDVPLVDSTPKWEVYASGSHVLITGSHLYFTDAHGLIAEADLPLTPAEMMDAALTDIYSFAANPRGCTRLHLLFGGLA